VSVFVESAAELSADDAALVIRQRDGRLDRQLFHQLAMSEGTLGTVAIAQHFT
jgi:hypothetical protein